MKRLFRFSSFMTVCLLVCFFTFSVSAVPAFTVSDTENKLLYLTASQEDIDNITSAPQASKLTYLTDIMVFDKSQIDTLGSYKAIALPYTLSNQIDLTGLFNQGVRIYLYGNVTVSDYNSAVGSSLEARRIVHDIGDPDSSKCLTQTIEDTGIEYAVIGWTKNNVVSKGLLCTFDCNAHEVQPFYYFKAVCNHFKKAQNSITPYSVELIDQLTDNVTYYHRMESATYMDWYLSQDIGERDANADYYAVTTHVWATADGRGNDIINVGVKNKVVMPNDDLYDCAPASTSALNDGSITVDLISGSISASMNFNCDPSVKREADYTNDTVEWTFYMGSGYNPHGLDNEVFKTIFIWSTNSSNAPYLDIEYRSTTQCGNIPPTYQDWQAVRVSMTP